ncbi:MAG: hypothetical protein CR974_03875 [Gammaproteobacteria bacterium]|nr:MAG: hypothetical protein CR974_03875 [Gammaproteobacteria bacterium]
MSALIGLGVAIAAGFVVMVAIISYQAGQLRKARQRNTELFKQNQAVKQEMQNAKIKQQIRDDVASTSDTTVDERMRLAGYYRPND